MIAPAQALGQLVGDRAVDERAGRGGALLAGERERGLQQRGDDVVEVGVGVDDDAFLPPISAITRLRWRWPGTTLAAVLEDLQADGAGAGEDDRVDARVGDQRLAGLVAARAGG